MKYFTPDLIVRMNSRDDRVLREALVEWDARVTAYGRSLSIIQDRLPRAVREFLKQWYLHDAEVLAVGERNGTGKAHDFWIVLRRMDMLISLRYSLLTKPIVEHAVLPHSLRSSRALWMYDEVSLAGKSAFRHEVLLSTGDLLKLRCKSLQILAGNWLLPTKEKHLKAVS